MYLVCPKGTDEHLEYNVRCSKCVLLNSLIICTQISAVSLLALTKPHKKKAETIHGYHEMTDVTYVFYKIVLSS